MESEGVATRFDYSEKRNKIFIEKRLETLECL
jgi:hypothetical protein